MDNSPLDAGAIISHYRIIAKLGAGGMGEVYLAQDIKLDRKVALKILPRQFTQDESRLRRFIQEAKAASTLNHPNIITIHEIGEEGSTQFIATELIQGETLRQSIARNQLSVAETLDVASQIAGALVEAHEAGIVHRDIKPENIMLRPNGLVKVLDFGLAKLTERRSYPADTKAPTIEKVDTDPGTVMGTVTYMSPEQVRGLAVDVRSDIFSLGVVIFEMLAGQAPFEGETTSDIISSILKTDPPPLAQFSREVSPQLQWVVSKALRKDRDERYQTAKELLGDLKNLKRELDVQSGHEKSAPTESSNATIRGTATALAAQTGGKSIAQTADAVARMTSSAEYLVSAIKRRRFTAIIALVLLAVAVAGLFAYYLADNTEVAVESIAVLPFENQSHDPETEYISDGLTESIINSLTQLPSLRVVARSSVFRYKGRQADPMAAGRELNVRAVLTGRILQRGDNMTVSAELMDIRDNKQLWGEQYERKVSGLLAMQREIAKEISNNLRPTLSGIDESRVTKRYTENPEAYRLYLKGRFHWNKRTEEGVTKGIEYFNQAIERDPRYAVAYTGLADCYSSLGFSFDVGSLSPDQAIPKAKAAAMKALELDDTLAEAHTSLAFIRLNYDWDWPGAEREFIRALELNPNYGNAHHWYSHYLTAMGRSDESLAESNRAMELDQTGLIINVHLGWHYLFAHQYDLAVEQLNKTVELDPNYGAAYWYRGQAYGQKGMYAQALTDLRKAKDLLTENVIVIAEIGRDYAVSGNRAEATRILGELKELSKRSYVSGYNIAIIYAGLGEKDRAFEWLENAYKERSDLLVYLKVDPRVDNLRSDPRFADLLRQIGLRP